MPPERNTRKRKGTSHTPSNGQPDDSSIILQELGVEAPLEVFFSQYPKFEPEPSDSPIAEFNRLCEEYEWGKDDPRKRAARSKFNVALKHEFGDLYGSDENDIENWHKLCRVLRIDPVPETLQRCRAAVLKKHVNLVDLVEGRKKEVRIFETEWELSEYTRETQKYFPKEDAVDGGVLRALRRHILAPRDSRGISKQSRMKRNDGLPRLRSGV